MMVLITRNLRDRERSQATYLLMDRPASLAAFVRERRRARGLTQRELAELAGVGTRFVSEVERGKATLRMDHVDRVLAVFGKRLAPVDRPRTSDEP